MEEELESTGVAMVRASTPLLCNEIDCLLDEVFTHNTNNTNPLQQQQQQQRHHAVDPCSSMYLHWQDKEHLSCKYRHGSEAVAVGLGFTNRQTNTNSPWGVGFN